MGQLANILNIDGRMLDFSEDIEVIRSISVIAQTWQTHRSELADLAISDVFQFINAIEEDQAFLTALAGIGLNATEVQQVVETISSRIGRIPEKYRKLIEPVSRLTEENPGADTGLVAWQLLDLAQAARIPGDIPYGFDLGLGAGLVFEAGDRWPRAEDSVAPPLLRMGLGGILKVNADAALPLNAGSLRLGVKNQASTALNYFFRPAEPEVLYGAAVAARLPGLCNPFSLDDVWRAFTQTDLQGLIVDVDGSTCVDIELGIAEGFTISSELAAAEVGLTVGVKVKREGEYQLVLKPMGQGGGAGHVLEAHLVRNDTRERDVSAGLGIDVDLEGLANRLRQILKRHQGAFDDVLSRYADYLTPGTYLQDHLGRLLTDKMGEVISNQEVQASLKTAVHRALGLSRKPTKAQLRGILEREVAAVIDGLGGVVTTHPQRVANEATHALAARLGIEAGDATDRLQSALTELIAGLQDDLTTKVKGLTDQQLDDLDRLLGKAGLQVSAAASKADRAVQGVREIIGKYENLLKRLIAATEDAARTRITARLTREFTFSSGRSLEVAMHISADTPNTREAYATLVRGDLSGVLDLLRATPAGISFDQENMTLTRFERLRQRLGFEVVFLGFEFGTLSIFEAEARVLADGSGRVSVVSNGAWLKRRNTPKEDREIRFVDAFELTAAKATRNLNIDLDLVHMDERLRIDEVIAFLQGFEAAALLPSGTSQRAAGVVRGWFGDGEQFIKADINLGLRLGHNASVRLLRLGDRRNDDLNGIARREIFGIALRELVEGGAYGKQEVVEIAIAVLEQQERQGESVRLVDVFYDYTPTLHQRLLGDRDLSPTFHKQRIRELQSAQRIHGLCMAFVNFVDTMGDIYLAEPSIDGSQGWTESDYLDAQKRLNRQIRRWLRVKSKFLFLIDEEAHPRTVAFVGALIALAGSAAGEEAEPGLMLSVVRRDGTPGTAVLV
ncbi:MAG: hypothetical protein P8172_08300 [Gammaproteobacteria bacterium]